MSFIVIFPGPPLLAFATCGARSVYCNMCKKCNNKVVLSCLVRKEAKWTSLEVRARLTFLETLISKYDVGPVKLPGLSRNGPPIRKRRHKNENRRPKTMTLWSKTKTQWSKTKTHWSKTKTQGSKILFFLQTVIWARDKRDSYLISVGTMRVKLRNAVKFQQKKYIRFRDDFSIFCHHYSVFQMPYEKTITMRWLHYFI